ncbi:methyl-accepting chemotaxis protein [Geotalea uraniireducens]|uniref:Methyl-accepting chemotaxis protein n=1 Tax=Geotalea uraniireducens TaxID=351604 RepID=A0ABM8EHZ0_9BACT|nr:methyl-accepting chemotaxis protein [Geotalea uraniireducens]BDV42024.1 methyl-accepting chemotaxis protein [Geotalea uraniireducens]
MIRKKLALKVLAILGITLSIGFATLGVVAGWLQFKSSLDLQMKNTRTMASILTRDIDEYMMKGDSTEVNRYIAEAKKKNFFVDLQIFNGEARDANGSPQAPPNSQMKAALASGKAVEVQSTINGIRALSVAFPLANEKRCQSCHDAGPAFLGGFILTTSLEQGYASARSLSISLAIVAVSFFLILLVTMYQFFRRTIVNHIIGFSEQVHELASGGGDLTRVIPVPSVDEIGELATGINKLTSTIHDIISRIARNASELAAAAAQLSATSGQMAGNVEKVAFQATTVATASEELAATSCEIAQNCTLAADGARQATDTAREGTGVVNTTVAVMDRIANRVKDASGTVEKLGSRSDQIGEIIGTIEDIADQTNLLALNAAIEAARAGEQGRGFAVVADEVRALAERTTRATREIGEMIKAIQQETKSAVSSMEEGVREVARGTEETARSGEALSAILQGISDVTSQVHQIATAAEEQTSTTGEISRNINDITTVVRDAAAGANESAQAAERLASLAAELEQLVGQFKLAEGR